MCTDVYFKLFVSKENNDIFWKKNNSQCVTKNFFVEGTCSKLYRSMILKRQVLMALWNCPSLKSLNMWNLDKFPVIHSFIN